MIQMETRCADKELNASCVCNMGLPWVPKINVMIEPCEHIFHKDCICEYAECPICGTEIVNQHDVHELEKLKLKSKKYYQKYTDVLSMTMSTLISQYGDNDNGKTPAAFLKNIPGMMGLIYDCYSEDEGCDKFKKGQNLAEKILRMLNTKITLRGSDDLEHSKKIKTVYIANHSCYFDFVIISYLTGCGFISSEINTKNFVANIPMNVMPILFIKRGQKNNTVDSMKNYIKQYNSLCVFPEGMISNQNTIIKFRTGAFNTGYPVTPIVLKYETCVQNMGTSKIVYDFFSHENLRVSVTVLETEYPPFDVEKIRTKMAIAGDFALSRVNNRGIKD